MIRRTNSFPIAQSSSFKQSITWSYSSTRNHAWSASWGGFVSVKHLTRSESWSNGWSTYWKGLHWSRSR